MLGPLAMNLIPALVGEDNWFRKNVIRFCPSRNHIGWTSAIWPFSETYTNRRGPTALGMLVYSWTWLGKKLCLDGVWVHITLELTPAISREQTDHEEPGGGGNEVTWLGQEEVQKEGEWGSAGCWGRELIRAMHSGQAEKKRQTSDRRRMTSLPASALDWQ